MRKEFKFHLKGHQVKVVNTWFKGAKLYIDGELKDFERTLFSNGSVALMSANLGKGEILEINPLSTFISVELDAYLISSSTKTHVYSSHKRLSLSEQRMAKE